MIQAILQAVSTLRACAKMLQSDWFIVTRAISCTRMLDRLSAEGVFLTEFQKSTLSLSSTVHRVTFY